MTRAVVVGGGVRGREHAAALGRVAGVTLVGVVDPDPEAGRGQAATTPWVRHLTDLPGGGAADYLVVATPPPGRADVVADALAATGARAVLVEKPVALDVEDAARIEEACRSAGAVLGVGHHWRCSAAFERVRAAIAAGALGPLQRLDGSCFGNLYDQGSHLVDAIRWLAAAEVERVVAAAEDDPAVLTPQLPPWRGWYHNPDHPAPAWVTADLTMTGGIPATLAAGLLDPRADPGVDDWRQARVVVVGGNGTAEAWASGRYRITTVAGDEADEPPLVGTLDSAVELHVRMLAALATGAPVPATGPDGRAAVEVLQACLRSAATARAVDLPLAPTTAAPRWPSTAPVRVAPAASVSVVINVDDDRGFAPDAIASWRHEQAYGGALELVLASDGSKPDLDAQLRGLLAPHDRYEVRPGASRIGLWVAGADVARGEVLVITEAHCAAEPGCLGALVTALEDPRLHAAAGRAVADLPTAFSRFDAEIFDRGAEHYGDPADWRKVVPHAFAIRRSTYLAVGGFDADLDLFAEQALGCELRRRGLPVASVDGARVRHRFAANASEGVHTTIGLARGQAALAAQRPLDDLERLLHPAGGLPPQELSGRMGLAVGVAALRSGVARADLARVAGPALLPRRARVAADALRLRASVRRAERRDGGPQVEDAYLAMVAIATRYARRQVLVERGPAIRPGLDGPGRWPVGDVDAGRLDGVLDLEHWHGTPFAWLAPFAVLATDLPPGRWRVVLDTGEFGRDPRTARVRVHLDGRTLPPGSVAVGEQEVAIELPAGRIRTGRPQVLTIATDPLAPASGSGDERRLGLPLVAVEVRPG